MTTSPYAAAAPRAGTVPVPATSPPAAVPFDGLSPQAKRVFVGLMLGMFVSSISQTIVSPALPIIVSELGGMEHYSWLATSAMLVSAVTVPIVGKLSDLYGRRGFYIAGLAVFLLGSVLAGAAQGFWWLVAARSLQGLGMGTLMPLSQTIIGDIIPPRQRGKYQGLMGAVFGVTAIAGPLAGGVITDHWGWRWLFYVSIPVGLLALAFIVKNLHLPHEQRKVTIDTWGIVTLTGALVALLLATSWGGTTYPWTSTQVAGLFAVGTVLLALFIRIELRAQEPVIPLRLFKSSIFTFANIASLVIAMVMFGAIFYVPVYAQGVLGVNATNSGFITIPMMTSMIVVSILIGLLITKTGRYKAVTIVGTLVLVAGFVMLARLDYGATQTQLTLAMLVVGLGLGAGMQTYVLVVQNSVDQADLGVATATTQFFRSAGATVGIAILGTIMTSRLATAIPAHLPAEYAARVPEGSLGAGSVLDPSALSRLPPEVATAVRQGLADALHDVFLASIPLALIAVVATVLIRAIPLRDTLHSPADVGREVLDELSQSAAPSPESARTR